MTEKKEKILIIRTGAIGDIVHTSNTYRAIKLAHKNSEIHYMTAPSMTCILKNDKDVDKIWTVDTKKLGVFSSYTFELAKKIKAENFDAIINLHPSLKTKFLVFLSGVKRTSTYKKDFKLHAVQNFWQTGKSVFSDIEKLPDLKISVDEKAVVSIKSKLATLSRPFIVFNAGGIFAKRQGRTYPVEQWLELGKKLQEKYKGTIILNGVKEDELVLKVLENIPQSVSFISKLSLEESIALISCADLLISGDSGPLHIATAFDVKTVGLYGSMPIARTGQYGSKEMHISISSKKECVPCNRRKCKYLHKTKELYAPCMKEIKIEDIMDCIEKLLKID